MNSSDPRPATAERRLFDIQYRTHGASDIFEAFSLCLNQNCLHIKFGLRCRYPSSSRCGFRSGCLAARRTLVGWIASRGSAFARLVIFPADITTISSEACSFLIWRFQFAHGNMQTIVAGSWLFRNYWRSSTRVAPWPPSFWGASAMVATWGCDFRNSRTPRRRIPAPWP